ncbi:hypothetical protein BN7_2046 [Wickerhamomyces ciferrii]|uniref:Uncharacterized protein n=1 Tax=Wickerhamomyces ciferrii (strain ATCC 14091 / BCRC 22168 / CBS 111 / JCM 3599 / NBRC 0793 / NRRL Y-1031 F-60-10) TaxID=1206466 RepID=K0KHL0_WICCF|nr:uncharacterized protein BN7_2046 [Wickerhamomyces ciferrii]CCH42501.1 hypothetical protein BN7_2046 [Wickerhamomyces ciferrii]
MFRSSLRTISRVSTRQLTKSSFKSIPLQQRIIGSNPIITKQYNNRSYATNASDLAAHPKVQELFEQMQKHPSILSSLQDIRDAIKFKTEQSIINNGELNESKLIEIFKDPEVLELFNKFFNEMTKAGLQITDPKQLDFLHAYIGSQTTL